MDSKEVKLEARGESMDVRIEVMKEPMDVKIEVKEDTKVVKRESMEVRTDIMDSKEHIEKFERYEAEFKQYLMSKYFLDKTIFGGNIFDVKMNIDGQTIAASRLPPYQSYLDPAMFYEMISKGSSSSAETPTTSASNGMLSTQDSSSMARFEGGDFDCRHILKDNTAEDTSGSADGYISAAFLPDGPVLGTGTSGSLDKV